MKFWKTVAAAFIPRLNNGFWPTTWKFDDSCATAALAKMNRKSTSVKMSLDFITPPSHESGLSVMQRCGDE
jgi:hypothetical protein